MEQNHRRHKRFEVEDVHGTLAHNLDARVLNISLTGMAIETRSLLKVGADYYLKIPQEGEPFRVKADVRWCHLVRTEHAASGEVVSVYKAGIDFRSILDEKALQMLEFIEQNVVVELDQRLFGRFHFASDENVDLDRDEPFTVRKLSLSGMLVETELVPTPDAVYEVEIRFNGARIDTTVRVAYVRPLDGEDGRVHVGMEFQGLSEDEGRKIESLIEGLLE